MAKQTVKKFAYLKLGEDERIHTFYDVTTGLHLNNKQVVRLKNAQDVIRPTIKKALASGHLQLATEDEYNDWKTTNAKEVADSQKNLKIKAVPAGVLSPILTDENDGEDADEDLDNDAQDEEDDDEDEDEDMTKSQLIDALKASPLIKDEQKKNLSKESLQKLQSLYTTIKGN